MCGAHRAPAVPPPISHLRCQQVFRDGAEPRIVTPKVGQDGQHHSCDARLAPTSPPIVDAAVPLEPSVKEEGADLLCRWWRSILANRAPHLMTVRLTACPRRPAWREDERPNRRARPCLARARRRASMPRRDRERSASERQDRPQEATEWSGPASSISRSPSEAPWLRSLPSPLIRGVRNDEHQKRYRWPELQASRSSDSRSRISNGLCSTW